MSKRISTSEKIVGEILDKGLAASTWREQYPDAYIDLEDHYREDLVASVRDTLIKELPRLLKSYEGI